MIHYKKIKLCLCFYKTDNFHGRREGLLWTLIISLSGLALLYVEELVFGINIYLQPGLLCTIESNPCVQNRK